MVVEGSYNSSKCVMYTQVKGVPHHRLMKPSLRRPWRRLDAKNQVHFDITQSRASVDDRLERLDNTSLLNLSKVSAKKRGIVENEGRSHHFRNSRIIFCEVPARFFSATRE